MPVRGKTGTVKRINRSMLEHKVLAWRNSTWMQSWAQVFGNRAILQSDGDKPPKGFEKFFKNRKNKDAKESSANDDKKEGKIWKTILKTKLSAKIAKFLTTFKYSKLSNQC